MKIDYNKNTDEYWLALLKAGDELALKHFYNLYYSGMVKDAFRILGNIEPARDIAQEIFVELWRKRDSIQIRTSLKGYLKKSVVNKSINYIKSNKLILGEYDNMFQNVEDETESILNNLNQIEDMESRLHAAIAQLPEKCRIVFALSRFEQLSHKDIAAQLDISVKTIENQITKAMKMLRVSLLDNRDLSSIVILAGLFLS